MIVLYFKFTNGDLGNIACKVRLELVAESGGNGKEKERKMSKN